MTEPLWSSDNDPDYEVPEDDDYWEDDVPDEWWAREVDE